MKKYNTLITIGILTAIIPFLGIPKSWKYFFTVAAGVAIAIIAIVLRRSASYLGKSSERANAPSYARTYIENNEER